MKNLSPEQIKKYVSQEPLFVFPTYLIELEIELCCDFCNEAIYYHLETCPVCKTYNAETNQFCHPKETIFDLNLDLKFGHSLEGSFVRCESCKAEFFPLEFGELKNDYRDYLEVIKL